MNIADLIDFMPLHREMKDAMLKDVEQHETLVGEEILIGRECCWCKKLIKVGERANRETSGNVIHDSCKRQAEQNRLNSLG